MIQKKQYLPCLRWSVSIILLLLLACNSATKEERREIANAQPDKSTRLNNFVKKHSNNHSTRKAVLVLYENSCLGCNKSYAKLMAHFINNPKAFLIIGASGTQIDISPFITDSVGNVYHDIKNDFKRLNITESSSAIFLNAGGIDTIVTINASELDRQLEFIRSKLF